MTKEMNLKDLREDYTMDTLIETNVSADAIDQFKTWMKEAVAANVLEPNAMTLSTVSSDGTPDARVVLLKGIEKESFVFYTNYLSTKAQQIETNHKICLTFLWKAMQRQVRITGTATKVSAATSDAYFASRPKGSRIGAWASPQSDQIEGRAILDSKLADLETQYAQTDDIPRPPHWGGYTVAPQAIEFWQGRSSRLHDRLLYKKVDGRWSISRLAP